MSEHTIYGYYNKTTGKIEFEDSMSGCNSATIAGCYVAAGEHAGEIKITHDYAGCETQYYACYDPETGKFKVDIDDGCCCAAPCDQCTGECGPECYCGVGTWHDKDAGETIDIGGKYLYFGGCKWKLDGDDWYLQYSDDRWRVAANYTDLGTTFTCDIGGRIYERFVNMFGSEFTIDITFSTNQSCGVC